MDNEKATIVDGCYGILWAEAGAILSIREGPPRGFKATMLGICGASGRIFKLANKKDTLTLLAVQNLYVTKGVCEEGRRCVDFDCPLNRTNKQTFAAAHNLKVASLPVEFGTTRIDYNRTPEGGLQDFSDLFKGDKGKSGWILKDRKRKSKKAKKSLTGRSGTSR